MSLLAVAWATEQDPGDPLAKLVLIMLADYVNRQTGEAWPSLDTLAAACCASRRTVINKLETLEAKGYITKKHRDNKGFSLSNVYTLKGCTTFTPGVQDVHSRGAGDAPNPVSEPELNPPRQGVETTLRSDWGPADPEGDASRYPELDMADEQARFRSHHLARGSLYRNWEQAWQGWLLKSEGYRARDQRPLRTAGRTARAEQLTRENNRRRDAYLARLSEVPAPGSDRD